MFQPEDYLDYERNPLIYLGKPLQHIVDNISFNVRRGNIIVDLMDYFPSLKQGYCLYDTIDFMIKNYMELINQYNAGNIEVFNDAFGANIPTEFFNTNPGWTFESIPIIERRKDAINTECIFDNVPLCEHRKDAIYQGWTLENMPFSEHVKDNTKWKLSKIPIQEAVDRKLVLHQINTYEYIKMNAPHFDPENYGVDMLEDLIFDNYYNKYQMPVLIVYHQNKKSKYQFALECELALEISSILYTMREPIDLVTLVNFITDNNGYDQLNNKLSTDDRIKLYYEIIKKDSVMVEKYLLEIDPRYNNNASYHLALEIGDKVIINMIKDNIIKRNWLDKQVFITNIVPLIGDSDIPGILQPYSRRDL